MWNARTKTDLMIEVWEKLDCESVGATEIEAIDAAVRGQFGDAAAESPMIVARLLADEGAVLRHSEIMQLYVKWASSDDLGTTLRNLMRVDDLKSALSSIKAAENFRRKYSLDNDKEGLRRLRETVLASKRNVISIADDSGSEVIARKVNSEISQWLSLWLQTPELFETWVELRQTSRDFVEKFGSPQNGDNA